MSNPIPFLFRCYAFKDDHLWVAVCIDFNLAAQGDSFGQVKSKLSAQIADYFISAIEEEDKGYAEYLLNRKAPLIQRVKYYWFVFLQRLHILKDDCFRFFTELPPPSTLKTC